MTTEEISIIRRYYAKTVKQLDEAEKAHNADKKNVKKRETYQYTKATLISIGALCAEIGVKIHDDNFNLIEET